MIVMENGAIVLELSALNLLKNKKDILKLEIIVMRKMLSWHLLTTNMNKVAQLYLNLLLYLINILN